MFRIVARDCPDGLARFWGQFGWSTNCAHATEYPTAAAAARDLAGACRADARLGRRARIEGD